MIPDSNERIHTPPFGFLTTYVSHFRAGLQFPLHPLFKDIMKFFQIQLGQLCPNVIRSTIGFIIIYRALGLEVSLELWRKFFILAQKFNTEEGIGYFYLQKRPMVKSVVSGPSSIHGWKDEFFYIGRKSYRREGLTFPWNTWKGLNNVAPQHPGKYWDKFAKLICYEEELEVGES